MLRPLLRALLLTLVSTGLHAGETASAPDDPVTFSLPAIEPWAQRTPSGDRAGLLVEMVEEIRQRTDVPITYRIRPHSRAILELEEGEADFVPTFASPDIDRVGKPAADIVSVEVLVLGRENDEPVESLTELEGENVGYLSGTWYDRAFADSDNIRKIPVNNVKHGLRLLSRERLKAVVATEVAIPPGIESGDGSTGVRPLMKLGTVEGKLYRARQTEPGKATVAIVKAMETMHEDGTMAALFSNRYQVAIGPD